MDNITDLMPSLIISTEKQVHVISLVQVRMMAAGELYEGDKDEMIRILAQAVKDLIE